MSLMRELAVPEQIALWDRRAGDADMLAEAPDPRLAAQLGQLEARRRSALDLGCGCGRHLLLLTELGWRATGVDWSQEALHVARRRLEGAGLVAELLRCDFRRTPLPTAEFSLIVAINALHHGRLADMRRAVLELKRLLRPGGTGIVSVPGRRNAPPLSAGYWTEDGTVVLGEGSEAGIPHHFSSPYELEQIFAQFRSFSLDTVVEPLPAGLSPLHRDHVNEWHWVTVIG